MLRGRLAFASVSGLAATLAAGPAFGDEPVALRLDCPTLDGETRALLEARARAEIASQSLPAGEMTIRCASDTATIVLHSFATAARERTVALHGADGVDAVLEAVHDLCVPEAVPPPPAKSPAPSPVPTSPPDPSPPRAAETPSTRNPPRLAAVVTADAELWHGGIGGALGGSGGARLYAGNWRATLLLGAERGLGSAGVGSTEQITAWGLRGVAQVDYEAAHHWLFGVGVAGRALWAQASSGTTAQQSGFTAGVLVAIRYALHFGAFELAAGPRAEALLQPLVIDLDNREVSRVPSFVLGTAIEAAFPAPQPQLSVPQAEDR